MSDENELISELIKLDESNICSKNFACIQDSFKDCYYAKNQAIADLMECLDVHSKACEFSDFFSTTAICKCPLRKLIAINFKELGKKTI